MRAFIVGLTLLSALARAEETFNLEGTWVLVEATCNDKPDFRASGELYATFTPYQMSVSTDTQIPHWADYTRVGNKLLVFGRGGNRVMTYSGWDNKLTLEIGPSEGCENVTGVFTR